MKTVALIQARLGSTRLPRKVLEPMPDGRPILHHVVSAVQQVQGLDGLCVATTNLHEDDNIIQHCKKLKIGWMVGDPDDVLQRLYFAARNFQADVVMRVTADCPLWSPNTGTAILSAFNAGGYDYVSNVTRQDDHVSTDGLDCEVFSFAALERAHKTLQTAYEREHVTVGIRLNTQAYRVGRVIPETTPNKEKWSVDRIEDLELVRQRWLERNRKAA